MNRFATRYWLQDRPLSVQLWACLSLAEGLTLAAILLYVLLLLRPEEPGQWYGLAALFPLLLIANLFAAKLAARRITEPLERLAGNLERIKGKNCELHPKSWTRKSTKGVQKSMGKELFSEELKLAVVQYVLEGHTRKEASEKFCVSCTPIEKWVNLYKLHGAKGLLSRNLVGRQKGFDGEFRLKVLQYKQEHHLSCTQTAMHFCLDVVTVCRWEKKFQKEGAQGLMKKQATKGSEKRQKKQEQSELQQENKRLSEENYRLKMENDYLKKLNALIQKREKPE